MRLRAAWFLLLCCTSSGGQVTDGAAMVVSVESRLRGALWGLISGDALASPTHWYYGGPAQIRSDYGPSGIVDYTQPVAHLRGSILNKSNTNGAGRGSFDKVNGISIVGDVINHGKRTYWDPRQSYHYHATLQAGENTLEAQLARVLMKSIVATGGTFDANHFRRRYVDFMTTPGSHNDTYASTCHRMFFANMVFNKLPPEKCPDNDRHNVDTVDGLVLPTITSLAYGASAKGTNGTAAAKEAARDAAAKTAAVTRKSPTLEAASRVWSDAVYDSLHRGEEDDGGGDFAESMNDAARALGLRRLPRSNGRDEMSACYLDGSLPTALDMICKYGTNSNNDAWTGLLANANVGGENVHRGAIVGAVLGARAGLERLPHQMVHGLYETAKLAEEIDSFVKAVTNHAREEL